MDLNPESRFFWALSAQLRCFLLGPKASKPRKSQGSLWYMWPSGWFGQWVTTFMEKAVWPEPNAVMQPTPKK